MSTTISITTDDMGLVARIAVMVAAEGQVVTDKPKNRVTAQSAPTPAPAAIVTQPVTAAAPILQPVTAAAPILQPVTAAAPVAPAAAPAPVAAVAPDERLKNAITLFLKSPGQDAARCAVIMREFTSKKVVGKDGVERQSANRVDVPPENVEACITKLKTGMPTEFQAQV